MSKYGEEDNVVTFDTVDNTPMDKLRFIERQFKRPVLAWHFKLLKRLTPNQIFSFFSLAKFEGKTIFFDGSTKNGRHSYGWVHKHYRNDLADVFGNIRVALATNGEIENSFKTYFSDKEGYLTKGEIELMFKLSKRASLGEKIDSYAELAEYRRANR